VDLATLRLPKSKEGLEMALHAAAGRLLPGAPLYLYGQNDEGVRSADQRLEQLFEEVEVVDTRKHCRVIRGLRRALAPELRPELADWARRTPIEIDNQPVELLSYPGVFARGGLDEGTSLLLGAIPDPAPGARVLDYGCGTGVIGATLLRRQPAITLQMVDVDALAVASARANAPRAMSMVSEGFRALPASNRYDLIISNPPLHRSVERDHSVMEELIVDGKRWLAHGGELWLVAQRQAPVGALVGQNWQQVENPDEDGRFKVWRLRAPFHPETEGRRAARPPREPRKSPPHR
jgi:16S rRNA (guanine1207-N2)-methyltransferase